MKEPKAPSPPQELEVGSQSAPYLLVVYNSHLPKITHSSKYITDKAAKM
jgi:hypothetical protein